MHYSEQITELMGVSLIELQFAFSGGTMFSTDRVYSAQNLLKKVGVFEILQSLNSYRSYVR
jgi:hypothetical protein